MLVGLRLFPQGVLKVIQDGQGTSCWAIIMVIDNNVGNLLCAKLISNCLPWAASWKPMNTFESFPECQAEAYEFVEDHLNFPKERLSL